MSANGKPENTHTETQRHEGNPKTHESRATGRSPYNCNNTTDAIVSVNDEPVEATRVVARTCPFSVSP